MKTLTLTINIGTLDAGRLGLTRTLEGETLSVSEKAAAEMLERGWAVEAASLKSAPPQSASKKTNPGA